MAVNQYTVNNLNDALIEFSKALQSGEKYVLGSAYQARVGKTLSFMMDDNQGEEVVKGVDKGVEEVIRIEEDGDTTTSALGKVRDGIKQLWGR